MLWGALWMFRCEDCQQPDEWAWKWIFSQVTLEMPADILIEAWWEALSWRTQLSHTGILDTQELWDNKCLSLYMGGNLFCNNNNWYIHFEIPFLLLPTYSSPTSSSLSSSRELSSQWWSFHELPEHWLWSQEHSLLDSMHLYFCNHL